MPGSFVPEKNDEALTLFVLMIHQRFQELNRYLAVGLAFSPAQERFLSLIIQRSIESCGAVLAMILTLPLSRDFALTEALTRLPLCGDGQSHVISGERGPQLNP